MAVRHNPDGSVTVGILTIEKPPAPKTAEQTEKPARGRKKQNGEG